MPVQTYKATVQRIETLTPEIKTFQFKLADPQTMNFKPGQFVILHVPHEGKTVKRAYSIASAPQHPEIVEFCIQKAEGGIASTYFWKLAEGDGATLSGPHGTFVLKDPIDYEPVLMCTGTGVAPFRSMIQDLMHRGFEKTLWLFFGTRYENTVLYQDEFRELEKKHPNFKYIPVVSRSESWPGEKGHIQDIFRKRFTDLPKDAENKHMYICGFDKVVKSVRDDLLSLGIPKEQVHIEEW